MTSCPSCGSEMKQGRLVIPGGLGIFWHSTDENGRDEELRLGPFLVKKEVNLGGGRCQACGTMILSGQSDSDSSSWWND